jgi:hypothetical protein
MFRNSYNCSESESKSIINYQLSITKSLFFLVFSFLLIIGNCQAQKPVGRFLTDSVEIGRPFYFALSYHHDPSAEVFFPDTTYNFYPFEMIKRNFYPTSTTNNISVDSNVYILVSFDISKIQKLSLPIYLLSKRDCTAIFSLTDSVILKEMIKTSVDSLTLQTDTKLLPVRQQINYLQIIIYLLGLLGGGIVIYALFGRYIRKQYKLFLFGRKHKEFQTNYKKLAKATLDDITIGKALVLWKKHLEWLEKRPYTSYTTKEIISRLPSERLEDALKEVDSAIYGGILSTQMPLAMNILLDKATELYKQRREELAASL